jgi:phage virion morphogenesis protein
MRFRFSYNDDEARSYFDALAERAQNTAPLMRDLAFLGEQQTREAFASETAPSGAKWQDSRRKQENGGKTLTDQGNLGDSVNSTYSNDSAEFGLGMMYAAIHQFGGTITPKTPGGFLKFKTASGDFAAVRSVTIPKRAMLPETLDEMDKAAMTDIVIAHLNSETP